MKSYTAVRPMVPAHEKLIEAGWMFRAEQVGGDFVAYLRINGSPGMLLVDHILGRFILDSDGAKTTLLTERSEADGNPEFDAVLESLFEGEVVA